jgi:hypothetical protein
MIAQKESFLGLYKGLGAVVSGTYLYLDLFLLKWVFFFFLWLHDTNLQDI